MHRLIRSASFKQLLVLELPAMLLALFIAEIFFKFGSFTLECLAFLPTWYATSLIFDVVARRTGLAARIR